VSYCRSCLVPHRVSPGLSRELLRRRHSSVARRTLIASAQSEGQADSVLSLRARNELILQRINDARRDPPLHSRYE
jgi:hypothetical protein